MGSLLLIDNDALLKLARYNLLDEVRSLLGGVQGVVCVLPTARYVLLPQKNRLKRCKDEETAARLEAFLSTATHLGDVSNEDLDDLNGIAGIDPGEALLFAATADNKDAILVTGDKRALAAFGSSTALTHIAKKVVGKVLPLEAVISLLIANSFIETQTRIRSAPAVDSALTIAFGVSAAADAASVNEALESYISDLKRQTGILLGGSTSSAEIQHKEP